MYIGGISAEGDPLWSVYQPPGEMEDEIYVGRQSLGAAELLGPNRSLGPVALTADGLAAWTGKGDLTGGFSHVFKGTRDISGPVLGPNGRAGAHDINDVGRILWSGGPGTTNWHVYVDDRDISGALATAAIGRRINNAGRVLWDGAFPGANWEDTFLDGLSLSASVYGRESEHYSSGLDLSETGHAAWFGWGDLGDGPYFDVFVDLRNVSREALGPGRYPELVGGVGVGAQVVDDFGRVLRNGKSPRTNGVEQVFVNEFALSLDAHGRPDLRSAGLALGLNGHALWASMDPDTYLWDIWLSTPVPEPPLLPLGLPLLALLPRRRVIPCPRTRPTATRRGARVARSN